jgi:hypothetical protein
MASWKDEMAMRKAIAAGIIAVALGGCETTGELTTQPGYLPTQTAEQPTTTAYANPFFVPIADPQLAWETITEVISDYFRIDEEAPVRMAGNMLLEGSIRTVPEVSPTIFEPWRNDTADYDQRVENTLQTMRRQAILRVMPAQGGYWVEVTVLKWLEDAKPEHATAGAATFRFDSTLTGIVNPILSPDTAEGWIARGRDMVLEQRIIGHLSTRCGR